MVEDMIPYIVEHDELKLIGIPCISLKDMSSKYHHAKEALLSSTINYPTVKNPSIQYGIWPQVSTQQQSDMHAYILCVEVESFEGIPEWYFRTTLPPQKCIVVSNQNGNFDAASSMVDQYISDNGITVGGDDRKYIICERYNYEAEGFARYSLPIQYSPIDNVVDSAFVHVSDLRRSAEWYSMVMGVPILEERLNGGNVYWLKLQAGTGIMLDDNKSNTPETPRVRYMYKTSNIEESYRFLEKLGVHPLYPIERPHPGLAYLLFTDPDGNSIMVTQSDYYSDVVERLADTESPILNRIGGIFLNVTDMNRAIRYHSKVLSLPYHEVGSGPENSIYDLQMKSGTGVLLDDNRFRQGDNYETLFMLVTKDVDASKAYLESNGVPVFTDIERPDGMAFFTVQDPDGNVIMICSEVG